MKPNARSKQTCPDGSQSSALPRTVVHYVDAATFGGVEQVVLMLLSRLDRSHWRPLLYMHGNPGIARLVAGARELGVECRSVPLPRHAGDLAAWQAFRNQLLIDQPAVFHAHLSWPLGCRHGIVAAKLARKPYVVATAHLYFPLDGISCARVKQWIQATAIDQYIAVSSEVAMRLCNELHVPRNKVNVVRNGIETSVASHSNASDLRKHLLEGKDLRIVLTVARLHRQKGLDFLLEAATTVPNTLFLLAGDGPERQRLQARIQELGLGGRVRLLGHRNDVAALLDACDLFVLPSLYEGLPLGVLEAMAAAKPVVATSIGGTDEAVIDGVTGRLVPAADSGRLAAAINELLTDCTLARRMAEEGQLRVRQQFSADAMARGAQAIYCLDRSASGQHTACKAQ
ncbi:Glycosyltransferase OS=Rhizobacter gummiphilus OX=946333 GN=A4W93_21260 PE=4 SV=1 [Rhizobacter fulvus]